MTDIATNTFSTTVEQLNFNIEANTNLNKSLSFFETVKTASDLSATTFELKLFYLNGLPALTKSLTVVLNKVDITLTDAELSVLNAKTLTAEIHKTVSGVSQKITEGSLKIT